MALELSDVVTPQLKGTLSNSDILTGKRIHPAKIIRTYDSSDFEIFIQEWAFGFLKENGHYKLVFKLGGPNDMGRDVIAYVDEERKIADYYQCKHYQNALSPTDIWAEIGKLFYHCYTNDLVFPRKYYFVAPRDVGSSLERLIHGDPDIFRQQLIKNWNKYCKDKITSSKTVILDKDFLKFISEQDFSVFTFKPILEVIDEHSNTKWAAPRFGGGLRKRPARAVAPDVILESERNYIYKLFRAYENKLKKSIKSITDFLLHPQELDHFKRQRNAFYSAEALRIYSRESLPAEYDGFEDFKQDIFDGVVNTASKNYSNGIEKVDAVTDRAMEIPVDGNILAGQIQVLDKHGVCHHLANEDRLNWDEKNDE